MHGPWNAQHMQQSAVTVLPPPSPVCVGGGTAQGNIYWSGRKNTENHGGDEKLHWGAGDSLKDFPVKDLPGKH